MKWKLLALLLASCGAQPHPTREMYARIVTAMSAIGVETRGEAQVFVSKQPAPPGYDGVTEWRGEAVTLRFTSLDPDVVAHELGHAMGLEHELYQQSVMYLSSASMNAPAAAAEIAALCKRKGPCKTLVLTIEGENDR